MQREVCPPALIGPGAGAVSTPLAGRGGDSVGADSDVGAGLEHWGESTFEAFGSQRFRLADQDRPAPGFGRGRDGTRLSLSAVAAEGLVVDVVDATGLIAVDAGSFDELHGTPGRGVGARVMW